MNFLDATFLDATVFGQCAVGMSSMLANLKSRFQSVPKWSLFECEPEMVSEILLGLQVVRRISASGSHFA